MFNFLIDSLNWQDRAVGHFETDDMVVDTAYVSDGHRPYETGIMHPDYREKGLWVIVEAYDTKEDAKVGHDKWVKAMTTEPLPDQLTDCCNALLTDLMDDESKSSFVYKRKKV